MNNTKDLPAGILEELAYLVPRNDDRESLLLALHGARAIIDELRTTCAVLEEEIGSMKRARVRELCAGASVTPGSYSVDAELRACRIALAGAVRSRETMLAALTQAQASGTAAALRAQKLAAAISSLPERCATCEQLERDAALDGVDPPVLDEHCAGCAPLRAARGAL